MQTTISFKYHTNLELLMSLTPLTFVSLQNKVERWLLEERFVVTNTRLTTSWQRVIKKERSAERHHLD